MNLKRLSNQEDFNNIQLHNFIAIEFQEEYEHRDDKFTICKNCFVNKHLNELIFNKEKNHWINIDMYLNDKSTVAKSIFLIEEVSNG